LWLSGLLPATYERGGDGVKRLRDDIPVVELANHY
jgi:hypothetical protein